MNLKINEELKALIPPLKEDEYKLLEKSLIDEGCRDKLITWNDTIVDGHNRYEICTKHGIPFETEDRDFDNIEAVKDWMDVNQLGRRNLTNDQRKIIIGRRYNREKKSMSEAGSMKGKSDGKNYQSSTAQKLANENNVTEKTVRNYAKDSEFFDELQEKEPETAKKVWEGETTLADVKKEKKKKHLEKKKKEYVESSKKEIVNKPLLKITDAVSFLNEFEDNTIDLLITDPPYKTDVEDIHKFTEDWLTVAIYKLKTNGRAYICAGAYPDEIYAFLNVLTKQNKFIVDNPLVWTYRNTLGVTPKMKYNLNYQLIWHLYSDESDELDTSITNEMFSVQDINAPDGRLGNRLHKWQKPDELARRLIRHSTKEDDLIVDCFACTGTFLLEGARMNRRATGCDISIDNAKIAEERGCTIIGKKI